MKDVFATLKKPIAYYHHWQYKNTVFLIVSLLALWYFADSPTLKYAIATLGNWSYVGAIITGIFFVSTFTVAPAIIVLYRLAETLNPIEIALLTGFGALIGDLVLYRFLKDRVFEEIKPLMMKLGGSYITALFKTPFFAWMLPIIGSLIIASPLPDETGVAILGASKLKKWQFLLLSFILNATGIFIIVTVAATRR